MANFQGTSEKPRHFDVVKEMHNLFVFFCILLFIEPYVKMCCIVANPGILYLGGHALRAALFLPPILVMVAHAIHQSKQAPSKTAVIIGIFGPAIVLALMGNSIQNEATMTGNLFLANECTVNTEKWEMEKEWQAAVTFHEACVKATLQNRADLGGAPEALTARGSPRSYVSITECGDYESQQRHRPAWQYFQHLEESYGCGGWCEAKQPLWTFDPPELSCSTAAAEVLLNQVDRTVSQVFIYSVCVLCISTILLILMGPTLRSKGLEW